MGHTVDTYDDIESLRLEKLRKKYATRGLSNRPKTSQGKLDTLKEIIRAYDMDPSKS